MSLKVKSYYVHPPRSGDNETYYLSSTNDGKGKVLGLLLLVTLLPLPPVADHHPLFLSPQSADETTRDGVK